MNSIWGDLSKNVSLKLLPQLILELPIKDWHDVAVKNDSLGTISIF